MNIILVKMAQQIQKYFPTAVPKLADRSVFQVQMVTNIDHNLHKQSEIELWSLTGELTHNLDHGVVTALAARRELVDFNTSTDFDGTPFTLFHFQTKENQGRMLWS